MATTERKARMFRQREQELLDAATALYSEQDWRTITVDQIAARADIAKGTVYLHVRTKDEVAAKLALRYLKRLAGVWRGVPDHLTRRERRAALLRAAQVLSLSHPRQFTLVQAALTAPAPLRPELQAELAATWRPLEAAFSETLPGEHAALGGEPSTAASALTWALLQSASLPLPLSAPFSAAPDSDELLALLES